MKEKCLLALLVLCFSHSVIGQTYFTRNGVISFYSDAPMEKIQSNNQQVTCRLDAKSGDLDFAVLIQAFQFEKAMMHKHFNEDYLESNKYPKASFEGQVLNIDRIDFGKDGKYQVMVRGTLQIHGQSRTLFEKGRLIIEAGKVRVQAKFTLQLDDYRIKVPVILKNKIAQIIQVEIDVDFPEPQ